MNTVSAITDITIEPGHEKMYLMPYANNKGTDEPAHPRSLISAFVVHCSDRMVRLVCISKISKFQLVSVAEQVSLCLAWSETPPEDTFCHDEAHIIMTTAENNQNFNSHWLYENKSLCDSADSLINIQTVSVQLMYFSRKLGYNLWTFIHPKLLLILCDKTCFQLGLQ